MNKEWKVFGKKDPYYGVCSSAEFNNANLTEDSLGAFFKTGDDYLSSLTSVINRYFEPHFNPRNAIDFGCGVGRLLIPFSRICQHVTGIDISPGMLTEAKKNLQSRGIENVSLVESGGTIHLPREQYDFIHSYIVFQHIPVKDGVHIFQQLLRLLKPGGIGALHFTYYDSSTQFKKLKRKVLKLPFMNSLNNIMTGIPFGTPAMQMNIYPLDILFGILQRNGILQVFSEYTNHDGYLGVILFFRK